MADHKNTLSADTPRLRKTIVLVGMMGCGKTAVGTELARQLNVLFVDSDSEIERAANAPIAEISTKYGEAFFRAKETLILERLLKGDPCVLSTGGGAFLSQHNRDLIKTHGISVWLDASLEILWTRVRHKTTRPLLMTENPKQTLADLLKTRQPSYAQAEVSVQTDGRVSIADMAHRVQDTLVAQSNVIK